MKRAVSTLRLACLTAGLLAGCSGSRLTTSQKEQATQQWNAARAGAMASLATDQLNDGNLEKCRQTLDQAIALAPSDLNIRLISAKLAIEQGRLEDASAHLELARQLDPSNDKPDYLQGVLFERWQQPEKARTSYAAAAAKKPDNAGYVLAQAEMLVAAGKPAEALAFLQTKSIEFDHSGPIRDHIGQLLVGQKRYDEAVVALTEAARLSTDDPTIREHLGFALLAAGRHAEAGETLGRLIKLPEYENRADLRAACADCLARRQQPAEAQRLYEAATQISPNTAGYWLGLAKVTAQLGDFAGADLAVRKAVSLDSSSSEAQCLLGFVRLRQNQLGESFAAFRLASDLDPRDSTSVTLQGYVLDRMGRTAEAKPYYERALALNPADALAKRLSEAAGRTN